MRKSCTPHRVMRAFCPPAAIAVVAGCSGALRHGSSRAPLDAQGQLFVRLRPFPPQLAGLKLEVASVSAVGKEGLLAPLELREAAASGQGDRLLALGDLEPGAYGGLSIEIRGTQEPAHIDHPFTVERGRASAIAVQVRPPLAFDAFAPPKTL